MLGTKCTVCQSQLLNLAGYHDRKRLTIGKFCPQCLAFLDYTDDFNKKRDKIIQENKENRIKKPKFLKKERMACPYCLKSTNTIYDKLGKVIRIEEKKPIINKSKWTIRKMPKKKDETQHWKCTCKLCGNVWTTNSGNEYHYYSNEMEKTFHEQEKLGF